MPLQFQTYSFADVYARIVGPGLACALASGAGDAKEGLTFDPVEDRNRMTIGAGGDGVHALIQNRAAELVVRVIKTAPTNNILQNAFNFQSLSSLNWGQNQISLSNPVTGDKLVATGVAFKRQPSNTWADDVNMIEWRFDALYASQVLGSGVVVPV